jgi:hypothetical protein
MNTSETLAYVKVVACALDLPLDETRAQAVAQHLMRTAALAEMLEETELLPEDELAEIFRPAPFPPTEGSV